MSRVQEPLKRLPMIDEEQSHYKAAGSSLSLTISHNIYFIEGPVKDAPRPLKKFRGFLSLLPQIGEVVELLGNEFRVEGVQHHLKLSAMARPDIYVILKKI